MSLAAVCLRLSFAAAGVQQLSAGLRSVEDFAAAQLHRHPGICFAQCHLTTVAHVYLWLRVVCCSWQSWGCCLRGMMTLWLWQTNLHSLPSMPTMIR